MSMSASKPLIAHGIAVSPFLALVSFTAHFPVCQTSFCLSENIFLPRPLMTMLTDDDDDDDDDGDDDGGGGGGGDEDWSTCCKLSGCSARSYTVDSCWLFHFGYASDNSVVATLIQCLYLFSDNQ